MLYLIYAESANYCGYGQHFVVEALHKVGAEDLAVDAIDEYFYEQDEEQLLEERYDLDGMVYHNIISIEENHFILNKSFYIILVI